MAMSWRVIERLTTVLAIVLPVINTQRCDEYAVHVVQLDSLEGADVRLNCSFTSTSHTYIYWWRKLAKEERYKEAYVAYVPMNFQNASGPVEELGAHVSGSFEASLSAHVITIQNASEDDNQSLWKCFVNTFECSDVNSAIVKVQLYEEQEMSALTATDVNKDPEEEYDGHKGYRTIDESKADVKTDRMLDIKEHEESNEKQAALTGYDIVENIHKDEEIKLEDFRKTQHLSYRNGRSCDTVNDNGNTSTDQTSNQDLKNVMNEVQYGNHGKLPSFHDEANGNMKNQVKSIENGQNESPRLEVIIASHSAAVPGGMASPNVAIQIDNEVGSGGDHVTSKTWMTLSLTFGMTFITIILSF